jgi:hypothetical protein
MSDVYDITLKKEVLIEVGADVYAQLRNYERNNCYPENTVNNPLFAMKKAIMQAQHNILALQTPEDLDRIRGQFDFVRNCLRELERTQNG